MGVRGGKRADKCVCIHKHLQYSVYTNTCIYMYIYILVNMYAQRGGWHSDGWGAGK